MADQQCEFIVPEGTDLKQLQSRLQKALGMANALSSVVEHTYYDSFEWLTYQSGAVLEKVTAEGESLLQWRALNSTRIHASIRITDTPRFVQDLPKGRLRTGLDRILEMRAFLPQVSVRSRVHTYSLLDKEGKTVMRLAVEQHTLKSTKRGKASQLGVRVRILPVRGYDKPVKKAARLLAKEKGLIPATQDLMLAALAAESRQPECYSSKLKLHLESDMRADAAIRVILLRLLEVIETNEDGTINDIDSEFLHDYRVAVRKTRSALTQIKGVLPKRILDKYRAGFAWLGSVTTPTRDMDVYLLNFDGYRSSLPVSIQDDLNPLHDFLIAHQQKEQAIMARTLRTARYRNMMQSWHQFLSAPLPARSTLPNATRPTIFVADKRIMSAYKRVMKEGLAITPDSPAERLHDLRKSCKKLRYLMEFFQSLYPAAKIAVLISALKSLQENLGDFQDYEVQATHLEDFSHQMTQEGEVASETLMAMRVLVEGLHTRQQMAREEFAKRFGRFSRQENQDRFHKLFKLPRAVKGDKT